MRFNKFEKGSEFLNKKYHVVGCKLSDDELKIFESQVMRSGLKNRSDFIRLRILEDKNIFGQVMLDKIIELEKKISNLQTENLKKTYVAQKLAAACLNELLKKEGGNFKEIIQRFIAELEKEAENIYGGD